MAAKSTWQDIQTELTIAQNAVTAFKRTGKHEHAKLARRKLKLVRKRIAAIDADLGVSEEEFRQQMKGR